MRYMKRTYQVIYASDDFISSFIIQVICRKVFMRDKPMDHEPFFNADAELTLTVTSTD
jgi:hypothetical protein